MIVTELKVVELTPSDKCWNLGQLFWHLITVTVTLAEVKFNDQHWDSGYYTFSSIRFLVFSTDHSTLSSTGSILSNTDLSDLSTVGTCDIFVYQMRHRVM